MIQGSVAQIMSNISSGNIAGLESITNFPTMLDTILPGTFRDRLLEITNPLPLQLAVFQNKEEVVAFLLDKGANPNRVHPSSQCPLAIHIAVRLSLPRIIDLLVRCGALLDTPDAGGLTPLNSALLYSDLPTFTQLLKLGANPWIVDNSGFGDTVLHSAARHGKWQQYNILANNNPSLLTMTNNQGLTPPQMAQMQWQTSVPPPLMYVDATQWQYMNTRVTALELVVNRIIQDETKRMSTCPACHKTFEDFAEWREHVRVGCHPK